MMRLQKYLALSGVASRRTSEKIIADGRVAVNGKVITEMKNYSIQFSHSVVSDSLRPHESQHARPPCP